MATMQPRYSKEEFARRGDRWYETKIRQQVEPDHIGKIVAIDIETGHYQVADYLITASTNLLTHYPDAQTWFIRIGHLAVDHFGARSLRNPQ
ncbi:MAG: hypothetical protein AAGD25_17995 [Cyanobacteria bacterium P01_F01_bin.150]